MEVIELHKTAAPPPIREKNRKVPRKMARIAMSALAKNPAERPPSAAGFASALRARSPKQFGFNFSMSGGSIFAQLLNVLVTPLTAIMASLLYLKTRKAGGESLRDASDQFEALDIPQSKWQARMKTRWTNAHPPTTRH